MRGKGGEGSNEMGRRFGKGWKGCEESGGAVGGEKVKRGEKKGVYMFVGLRDLVGAGLLFVGKYRCVGSAARVFRHVESS